MSEAPSAKELLAQWCEVGLSPADFGKVLPKDYELIVAARMRYNAYHAAMIGWQTERLRRTRSAPSLRQYIEEATGKEMVTKWKCDQKGDALTKKITVSSLLDLVAHGIIPADEAGERLKGCRIGYDEAMRAVRLKVISAEKARKSFGFDDLSKVEIWQPPVKAAYEINAEVAADDPITDLVDLPQGSRVLSVAESLLPPSKFKVVVDGRIMTAAPGNDPQT